MSRTKLTCAFEREDGSCRVIACDKCTYARKRVCSFSESPDGKRESQERAYARLRSLPELQQRQIADQYFGGDMPWKINS